MAQKHQLLASKDRYVLPNPAAAPKTGISTNSLATLAPPVHFQLNPRLTVFSIYVRVRFPYPTSSNITCTEAAL